MGANQTTPFPLADSMAATGRVAVVGASAGGVEALTNLARNLPSDLDLTRFVVLHMPRGGGSRLAEIVDMLELGPLLGADEREQHGGAVRQRGDAAELHLVDLREPGHHRSAS